MSAKNSGVCTVENPKLEQNPSVLYAPKVDEEHPRTFNMKIFRGIPVRMKELELFPSILCFCPNVCAASGQDALRSLQSVRQIGLDQTTLVLRFFRHFARTSRTTEREEQSITFLIH